jgi:Zn finger protein HypA/HybF involved in hydrogenase expression
MPIVIECSSCKHEFDIKGYDNEANCSIHALCPQCLSKIHIVKQDDKVISVTIDTNVKPMVRLGGTKL